MIYSPLFTDLYEITMSAIYYKYFKNAKGKFELWVRNIPENRGYLIFSGLRFVIEYLKNLHFEKDEIEYLKNLEVFKNVDNDFFDYLLNLKFEGNLWAMDEGSLFFENEPVIRIEGRIVETQIVETALLNFITYNTLITTKASRIVYFSSIDGKKRNIVEFGARRAPSFLASIYAAYSSYIGGFDGTSNLYAGKVFNIPVFGTMAHSFVLSFEDELEAFKKYYDVFPDSTILLVDTFDTEKGVKKVKNVGKNVRAIRIDSGNIIESSKKAREILDRDGLNETGIFISGDLDEYKIFEIVENKSPVNGFGVGTKLVTNNDCPYLSTIYKLVEFENEGKIKKVGKLSEDKITYPGAKQVFRFEKNGYFKEDVVCEEGEKIEEGEKLLKKYIENGKVIRDVPGIEKIREYVKKQLEKLPEKYKKLKNPEKYPVEFSDKLKKNLKKLKEKNG